ncbi:MAG TPA: hypothetical protein PL149_07130 [Candidatus Kapabacteria bacterium]|nr:hypothetical protein [Candidatus Kapabacteria bacterium]
MEIERLKGEPKKAFDEFQKYLQLPKPRNLELLASDDKHLQQLRRYCEKWQWEERTKAFNGKQRDITDAEQEISLDAINNKLMVELKNFSWIFADALHLISSKLSNTISRNAEIDLDAFSKQISLILKNLQDFLKIKEFLQENDSQEIDLIENVFENEKIKDALFDLRNLILQEINQ